MEESKICVTCLESKSLSDFTKNKLKKDGLQNYCKLCKKEHDHKHYLKHKDKNKEKRRGKLRPWLDEYKKNLKCVKCNYDKCISSLDFHHLDSKIKDINISNIIASRKYESNIELGIETLLKEVEKCVVLCANCHREFHYEEYRNNITIEEYLK